MLPKACVLIVSRNSRRVSSGLVHYVGIRLTQSNVFSRFWRQPHSLSLMQLLQPCLASERDVDWAVVKNVFRGLEPSPTGTFICVRELEALSEFGSKIKGAF